MTAFLEPDSATSDLDLIGRARQVEPDADPEAVAELYRRHHDSALRYACSLTDPVTAEDVVAEAFARVLETLRAGGGPSLAFRPYLLRTVQHVHVSHVRGDSRFVWVDDTEQADDPALGSDAAVRDEVAEREESSVLASAFSSLPERWQAVLWHTAVEDDDHATVGRMLGIKANAVAALGFRARDGLRKAYLSAHLGEVRDESCLPYRDQLAPYVRGRLGRRARLELEQHLRECAHCSAGVLELGALNSRLGALLAPALLGAGATGYAVATASTVAGGWLGLLTSGAGWVSRHSHSTIAAGTTVTVGAAAVVTTAVLVTRAPEPAPETVDAPSSAVTHGPVLPAPASGAPHPVDRPVQARRAPVVLPPDAVPPSSPAASPPTVAAPVVPGPSAAAGPTAAPAGPTAHPSATPPATPPATPSPTSTPTPSASPTASPTVGGVDLSLRAGHYYRFGKHHHVEVVVASPLPAVLTLDVRDYQHHAVHTDHDFPGTTCSPAPATPARTADRTLLTCALPPGSGHFEIDLLVGGALDVHASVSAPGNSDPDPGNDTWSFVEADAPSRAAPARRHG
ncbi:MAG TPA: sigma-70 family RNA polymerase sigma factor [Nocardioides sp.]|uniref:RNA polymerase sigma factor n=1 Tax=Nocardioides sp. TaxID=35761 RepID=UPI002C90A104|nr:sigma-70 family RNA polymerase sigma factor [Nocardioides sp.]HTW17567.1 sigma-70 family RNA polymerase sigma factor [Nocardioides sp.]